jgi:hypothetical protein
MANYEFTAPHLIRNGRGADDEYDDYEVKNINNNNNINNNEHENSAIKNPLETESENEPDDANAEKSSSRHSVTQANQNFVGSPQITKSARTLYSQMMLQPHAPYRDTTSSRTLHNQVYRI